MKRDTLLIGLLGSLVLFSAGRLSHQIPTIEPPGESLAPVGDSEVRTTQVDVVALDADALEAATGSFEMGRQLFRYVREQEVAEHELRGLKAEPLVAMQTPEPAPAQAFDRPPTDHLRYLGSFGTEVTRIAVVATPDRILNLRRGDEVENGLLVRRIGSGSLQLDYPGRETQSACLRAGGGQCDNRTDH